MDRLVDGRRVDGWMDGWMVCIGRVRWVNGWLWLSEWMEGWANGGGWEGEWMGDKWMVGRVGYLQGYYKHPWLPPNVTLAKKCEIYSYYAYHSLSCRC